MENSALVSKTTTRCLAFLIFVCSCLVLMGWQYNILLFKNLFSGWISIKPIVAIGFMMFSLGIWLFPSPPSLVRNTTILFTALVGMAIALAVLMLRYKHSAFNLNQLIFPQLQNIGQASILTAINFILVAIAFIFTLLNQRWAGYTQYLFVFSLIIPLLVLIGYLYNIPFFYDPWQSGSVSFITALLFIFSGVTALFSNPVVGIMRIFRGHQPGDILAKYLIPFAIIIPIVAGYFRIKIENFSLLSDQLSDTAMAMMMIFIPVPILWSFAFWINKKDSELRRAKEKAEHGNRAKSVFLAIMSHEIRTPLNGVLGMTTLLQDTAQTSEQKNYTDNIRLSGETLLRVINDILDYSKIEAGKLALEFIDFDVHKLLDDSLKMVEAQALQKGLSVNIKIDPSVPAWINGDPTRINQILMNLLSNAIKFTHHGQITVGLSIGKPKSIEVAISLSENNMLHVEVSDMGIGITPEVQSNLFKPFSQGELSTTRKYGGTGLGLTIAKRLADGMGGEIGVDSTLGQGSTFWFTVPLKQANSQRPIIEKSISPVSTSELFLNAHILVAEDNPINQQVAINLLKRLGFTKVDAVGNGLEALSAFEKVPYDLIFMDCEMPEMDGYHATRIIRNTQATHVPIIAMTAHALQGDKEKCLEAGMDDYIPKPIDRKELLRVLQQFLPDADGEHPQRHK